MSAWWLVLIVPVAFVVGMFCGVMLLDRIILGHYWTKL